MLLNEALPKERVMLNYRVLNYLREGQVWFVTWQLYL